MKKTEPASITITNPALKLNGAMPKTNKQLVNEALYTLAKGLKGAIENSKVTYPSATMSGYKNGRCMGTRLLVATWKEMSKGVEDFFYGDVHIKKARRTRIPGTNEYVLGDISKKELNDMAKAIKKERRTSVKK